MTCPEQSPRSLATRLAARRAPASRAASYPQQAESELPNASKEVDQAARGISEIARSLTRWGVGASTNQCVQMPHAAQAFVLTLDVVHLDLQHDTSACRGDAGPRSAY